ncbi:MAG: hypothetical protein P8Y68_15920, partial [Anaerolineales bacterium]
VHIREVVGSSPIAPTFPQFLNVPTRGGGALSLPTSTVHVQTDVNCAPNNVTPLSIPRFNWFAESPLALFSVGRYRSGEFMPF